jgi:hypothetical protein
MSSIYCLYATSNGHPRYIGQTTKPVELRLAQHLGDARRQSQTPLCRWIRATTADGFRIHFHTLQAAVAPADLNLFERYWMGQFANLLNTGPGMPRTLADSAVAIALQQSLRAALQLAG